MLYAECWTKPDPTTTGFLTPTGFQWIARRFGPIKLPGLAFAQLLGRLLDQGCCELHRFALYTPVLPHLRHSMRSS